MNPWVRCWCPWCWAVFPFNYWAVLPPSTANDAPVMKGALSDERNTMVCAISSGLPCAFERHAPNQAGLPFTSASEPVQHPGLDRTRGDHVDADAGPSCLERRRLGQPFDRVLAG